MKNTVIFWTMTTLLSITLVIAVLVSYLYIVEVVFNG